MNQYIFKPNDDMTTKELAAIVQVLIVAIIQAMSGQPVTGHDDLEIEQPVYDNLSSELKKYFKLKPPPPGGRPISPLNPPPRK